MAKPPVNSIYLSKSSQILISVIIPHYEDLARLDLCLSAIQRQNFPRAQFEIIVADNGSPVGADAVAKIIAGRGKLVVVEQRGAGPARNGGAAIAKGDAFAFTDSDCIPDENWLSIGLRALSDFDFVGGEMKVLVDDPKEMTAAEAFEYIFAFENQFYIERRNFTVSANLFCSKRVFEAVGGFRCGLSEDIDWSHRALANGYKLGYAAGSIVWHPARNNWSDLSKKWSRINKEFYLLHKNKKNGLIRYLALIIYQIPATLLQIPKILNCRDLNSWAEKWGVIKLLFKLRIERLTTSISFLFSKSSNLHAGLQSRS
jgi:glycosyltransferase involved in cell wall biosynthesis